jgi:PST family polysaccharide transporter
MAQTATLVDKQAQYLKAVRLVAYLVTPVMVGLIITAPEFVEVLFGDVWLEAVPIIRVLSLAGLAQAVIAVSGTIYLVTARTDLMFRYGVIFSALNVVSIVLGLTVGGSVLGVASYYAVMSSVLLPWPILRVVLGLVDLHPMAAVRQCVPALVAAGVLAICIAPIHFGLAAQHAALALALEVFVGAMSYVAVVYLFERNSVLSRRRSTSVEQ